jgi:phosphoesterase RecJ-like protein
MLDDHQQFKQLIENSQNILVVFSENHTEDAIASALALKTYLIKKQKKVDIVSHNFELPHQLKFLPHHEDIKPELAETRQFIIKVDISGVTMKNLSYDIKNKQLAIHLSTKQGEITRDKIKTAQTDYKYDLIVVLDTPDLEALGGIFSNNTDLFYKTPIINIDHNSNNEHFGQLNFVEITATSTTETLFKLLEQTDSAGINEEIATCLLTGMISKTQGFRTNSVTPKTLKFAGRLMNLGADREKIVKHLYQTKTIASLKLWGEALANLKIDSETGLIWTTLTQNDFIKCGAEKKDLTGLVEEIMENTPAAKAVLVIYEEVVEKNNKIHAIFSAEKNLDAERIAQNFEPIGNRRRVSFNLANKNIVEAEKEIVTNIKEKIRRVVSVAN